MSSLFAAEVVGMSQVVGCTVARNTSLSELLTIKSTRLPALRAAAGGCPWPAAALRRLDGLALFVRNVVILGR